MSRQRKLVSSASAALVVALVAIALAAPPAKPRPKAPAVQPSSKSAEVQRLVDEVAPLLEVTIARLRVPDG